MFDRKQGARVDLVKGSKNLSYISRPFHVNERAGIAYGLVTPSSAGVIFTVFN